MQYVYSITQVDIYRKDSDYKYYFEFRGWLADRHKQTLHPYDVYIPARFIVHEGWHDRGGDTVRYSVARWCML